MVAVAAVNRDRSGCGSESEGQMLRFPSTLQQIAPRHMDSYREGDSRLGEAQKYSISQPWSGPARGSAHLM